MHAEMLAKARRWAAMERPRQPLNPRRGARHGAAGCAGASEERRAVCGTCNITLRCQQHPGNNLHSRSQRFLEIASSPRQVGGS